jgi:hypothetical protein
MDKSRPVVQPAGRGLGFTAFPGHDGTASTLPRYYSDARPRDWEPFERSGVHKRDPDRSAGSLCFCPHKKAPPRMLKDGRRVTTRRRNQLPLSELDWTPPCGILDSTFFGPRFPWRAFFYPQQEATGTDFPFLNLSLQQGMRTFPPCAFSTSMLSGGSPDL